MVKITLNNFRNILAIAKGRMAIGKFVWDVYSVHTHYDTIPNTHCI